MTTPDDLVRAAIVIPAYGHSVWVADAIVSATAQTIGRACAVMVVIDGDPATETIDTVEALALESAGAVTALWRRHGGLSAARNAGVDYALARFTSLEAIYFLDADNTLHPEAMRIGLERLGREADVDFLYPHLQTRGLESSTDMGGPPSQLALLRKNYIEAGSLVRARVFKAGHRFDETMQLGYEDWDFWLSLMSDGCVGRNEPALGLNYRRRPESMLSNTSRNDVMVRGYIEAKHANAYGLRARAAIEEREAPRYELIDPHAGLVWTFTDPSRRGDSVDLASFAVDLWAHIAAPTWRAAPPFIVFADISAVEAAEGAGLINWIFWEMERASRGADAAALKLQHAPDRAWRTTTDANVRSCHFRLMPLNLFVTALRADPSEVPARAHFENAATTMVACPLTPPDSAIKTSGIDAVLATLAEIGRSCAKTLPDTNWMWRPSQLPRRNDFYRIARLNPVVASLARTPGRSPDVVLCLSGRSGAIQGAIDLAEALRTAGAAPHLCVMGDLDDGGHDLASTFDSLILLPETALAGGGAFLGTDLPGQGRDLQLQTAGALAWAHTIVNFDVDDIHLLAGSLRRWGLRTVLIASRDVASVVGRPFGGSARAIAYEHAYDLILTDAQDAEAMLSGLGAPQAKIATFTDYSSAAERIVPRAPR